MVLEIFGYVASVLVAVSLTMSNIFKLRVINAIGAAAFSAYGFLLEVWPVFVLNGFIVLVDLYYLWKMQKDDDFFEYLSVDPFESHYLLKFIETYEKDIVYFYPGFSLVNLKRKNKSKVEAVLILTGLTPVALFIYEKKKNKVHIKVDYTTPDYRNLTVSKFLYSSLSEIVADNKCRECFVESVSVSEIDYFLKAGFIKVDGFLKMDIQYPN